MAILKELDINNTGIALTYWRINCVSVDMEENVTKVRVGGYIDGAAANTGKRAIHSVNYTFAGAQNPIGYTTDPREYQNLLYAKIVAPANAFMTNTLANGEVE